MPQKSHEEILKLLKETALALEKNNMQTFVVKNKAKALQTVKWRL